MDTSFVLPQVNVIDSKSSREAETTDSEEVQFPNPLSEFVFTRTYPRWREEDQRRETYREAVDRYVGFLAEERRVPPDVLESIRAGMLSMEVLPSMRAFWSAGKAARRDNTMFYNCAFIPLDSLKSFSELLYILMQGTGIGYSVERKFVGNLPSVAPNNGEPVVQYVIPDTGVGWMESVYDGMTLLFKGQLVEFDYSQVRPAGARLKTKGGRASGPEPLRNLLDFITKTVTKAQGRKLTTLECSDIACMIGEIVMAGGVRRAALICFSDPDDMLMRHAKDWSQGDFPELRYMANLSAFWEEKPDRSTFDKEWVALKNSGSGERGFFMFPPAKRDARRGDCRMNPCLTGDTLVAVADGRGSVSFMDLAKADEDVPVYCYDGDQNVVVRKMRAPRKTGKKVPVFKVTLDDGSTFRATANHRFVTREGVEKRVDELQPGDRLQVLSRWLAPTKKGGQDYWWVSGGWQGTGVEHRRIVEYRLGRPLNEDEVVHHKDYDGSNNGWGNLEPMLKTAHDDLHRQDMVGDKNPMRRASTEWSDEKWAEYRAQMSDSTSGSKNGRFCGLGHDDLYQEALSLTRSLGRLASTQEWWAYAEPRGLPLYFGPWRRQSLGSIAGMLRRAAFEAGFEAPLADNRVLRKYRRMLEKGYDVEVLQGLVVFNKVCEVCGKPFGTTRREHGICYDCGGDRQRAFSHRPEHLNVDDSQIRIYNTLKLALGRAPTSQEFTAQCKEEGSQYLVPVRRWEQFEHHCRDANHIIVSIEADGVEDVYNGTVDEFHNFFIGGWESQTNGGKLKQQFVNTQNCGEILLRYKIATDPWTGEGGGGQFCNLSAAVMRPWDTRETFAKKVRAATWIGAIQSTFTHFPNLRPAWKQHCDEDRLLGVDITGHCDNPELSGDPEALLYFNRVARETAAEAASFLDIPMPASITCGKPSGNSSQMVDCASGFHTRFAGYYIRRVRISGTDPLFQLVRDSGVPVFKDNKFKDVPDDECPTWVVEFPVKSPEGAMTRADETALQQLERYLHIMRTWCNERGHNQSATVYVRDHEWDDVGEWLYENFDEVTGLSFLPYDGGKYELAPYEEIDESEYQKRLAAFPEINYDLLQTYEREDMGSGAQELACVGGACEIGDWSKEDSKVEDVQVPPPSKWGDY
jgi:hypothetical protein